jgi:hypothetical protein
MPEKWAFSFIPKPCKLFKKAGAKSGSAGLIFLPLSVFFFSTLSTGFYHLYDHRS